MPLFFMETKNEAFAFVIEKIHSIHMNCNQAVLQHCQ